MRLVIVESPYAGDTEEEIELNVKYARQCVRDCLERGEAPIASHLLYTQPGVLRDEVKEERQWGMKAGHAWMKVADAVIVYEDQGISKGMHFGIRRAANFDVPVEHRKLYPVTN